jgi:DnaJ-class molecular chaperone
MRNKAPNSQSTKKRSNAQMQAAGSMLNPGDEAPRGTPGTGDDICPECHGNGRINGSPCPNCGGGGTITRAIGGA